MREKLAYIFFAAAVLFCTRGQAQSDISMTTHWNNRSGYNPAFIARPDYLYVFGNMRRQWMGVNGAPVTATVQVSEYINSLKSAFGLSFVSDNIGATRTLNPMASYAYRISIRKKWALAMGLSGGVFTRTTDGTRLEAETMNDPSLSFLYQKMTRPDVNAGVELQNSHFIFGLSSTHLFSIAKPDSLYLNANHRYAYAIYRNDEPENYGWSLGLQVVNRYNMTVGEANMSVRLKQLSRLIKGPTLRGPQEVLDLGMTVRSSGEISALCGLMVNSYLRIGYAYGQNPFSDLYRNGTHEIMLEYRIPARSASTSTRCGSREFWYR